MSFKKWVTLAVLLLFALSVVGTGGCAPEADEPAEEPENDEPVDEEPAEEEPLKVALCTSGPVTDGGWNTLAYEGLQSVEQEFGAEIAYTESVAQDDQVSALRDYARADYDIIIGHGYEWEDSLINVAEEFPDIWFAQVGGDAGGEQPNLTSAVITTGAAGHVAGIIAGELTETGKAGFVGAMEIPTIMEEVMTARATVEQMYDYEMVVGFTGSWTDVSAGYEAASAQIEEGVDVIIGIGNAADGGAIQASQERDGEVWYIGWVGDLNHMAPDIIATSMEQDIGLIMRDMVQRYLDGEEGVTEYVGVETGHMATATWADGVPEEVKEKALEVQSQVQEGELTRLEIFEMFDLEPLMEYD